jgi:hypothetical protein
MGWLIKGRYADRFCLRFLLLAMNFLMPTTNKTTNKKNKHMMITTTKVGKMVQSQQS